MEFRILKYLILLYTHVLPWSMISTFRPKVKRGQQQVRQPS